MLVLTDASYIIKYMTRFTEEGFSSLISFIFISDAIKKMVGDTLEFVSTSPIFTGRHFLYIKQTALLSTGGIF